MKTPKPHEYQEKAIQFHLDNPSSYDALDMGLGKSLIAIEWMKRNGSRATLVLAPLRTIYSSWPDELEKWAPALSWVRLHGPEKVQALSANADIYLMNFEGIPWLLDQLIQLHKTTGSVPFDSIVIDEGSMVKSHSTKRFKTLKKMLVLFPKWKLILSGTPAPNSLMDLWSQYYLLDEGERLGKFVTHFRCDHFHQVDRMGFVWNIRKGAKEIIYKAVEDITYRLDAEDYLDLPKRIDVVKLIRLSKKVLALYKKLETEFFLELDNVEIEAFNKAALSSKLRQFVQGAVYTEPAGTISGPRLYEVFHTEKLKALEDIVETANGQGILCAIQFRFELDLIKNKYPNAPIIAGGVKAEEAGRLIRLWNEGEIPLLICHPASLSHGVNLQMGGHIIVWYALTWSLEQFLQFNARLHRQGQINQVIIHFLVCEGTIDERVLKALQSKFKGQKEFLDYLKGVR